MPVDITKFATRDSDLNFRVRLKREFVTDVRNKASFKVRELANALLATRCNVESRLKDAPCEGASSSFLPQFRNPRDATRENRYFSRRREIRPNKGLHCSPFLTQRIFRIWFGAPLIWFISTARNQIPNVRHNSMRLIYSSIFFFSSIYSYRLARN